MHILTVCDVCCMCGACVCSASVNDLEVDLNEELSIRAGRHEDRFTNKLLAGVDMYMYAPMYMNEYV